jgi:hypothetical protein
LTDYPGSWETLWVYQLSKPLKTSNI